MVMLGIGISYGSEIECPVSFVPRIHIVTVVYSIPPVLYFESLELIPWVFCFALGLRLKTQSSHAPPLLVPSYLRGGIGVAYYVCRTVTVGVHVCMPKLH